MPHSLRLCGFFWADADSHARTLQSACNPTSLNIGETWGTHFLLKSFDRVVNFDPALFDFCEEKVSRHVALLQDSSALADRSRSKHLQHD